MADLTVEEMGMIAADHINGRDPRVEGPEADAFRESLDKNIETAKSNGWELAIPSEWDVAESEESE